MMQPKQSNHDVQEGWMIHVYGGDRRLLCSLEASHIWFFIGGLVVGLFLAGIVASSQRPATTPTPTPNTLTPPLAID